MNATATIRIIPYLLRFKKPARTSRSVLKHRQIYWIVIKEEDSQLTGWGEIAPLEGLSPEGPEFHKKMKSLAGKDTPVVSLNSLMRYPSFRFGVEAAMLDLKNGGKRVWFPGTFSRGESTIPINGLIWMGNKQYMLSQIKNKLSEGYQCLKLKIGGIDFKEELELLRMIRKEFSPKNLELRLDANGSFHPEEAFEKLKVLSKFKIHSIEQPIPAGLPDEMGALCESNIIDIALDEELVGINILEQKEILLNTIRPQYIIFKPSLIGGLAETMEYIHLGEQKGIQWWVTSALESNVGLNILAQFCDHLDLHRIQGLGTGKLFDNNVQSPLCEEKGKIFTQPSIAWGKIMASEGDQD